MKIAHLVGTTIKFVTYTIMKTLVAFVALCVLMSVYATYVADKHIIVF